ncbi:ribonuclease H family protein [Chryseobacterium aquaticum]|nr:hypothetical protein [Chryseobacterium aquaticum]
MIQRFWMFNKMVKISPSEISLYFFLLKIAYENDHYTFEISDTKITNELGLNQKTVKSAREKLEKLGILEFKTTNGRPCYYRLFLSYSFNVEKKNNVKKETERTEMYQKCKVPEILTQTEIPIPKNSDIPPWDEFINYARTLANYEVHLDLCVKEKYDSWIKNGWKNSSKRPIGNWKATLKNALPYMKNSQDKGSISIENIPNIKRPEP